MRIGAGQPQAEAVRRSRSPPPTPTHGRYPVSGSLPGLSARVRRRPDAATGLLPVVRPRIAIRPARQTARRTAGTCPWPRRPARTASPLIRTVPAPVARARPGEPHERPPVGGPGPGRRRTPRASPGQPPDPLRKARHPPPAPASRADPLPGRAPPSPSATGSPAAAAARPPWRQQFRGSISTPRRLQPRPRRRHRRGDPPRRTAAATVPQMRH